MPIAMTQWICGTIAIEDHAVCACYAASRMQGKVYRNGDESQKRHGMPVQRRVELSSGAAVARSIANDLHNG